MFANTMKTGLLMFGLVALFTAIGGLLGNFWETKLEL